jgi:hypothetical protein
MVMELLHIPNHKLMRYILNQHEHHKKKSFKEEYLDILKKWDMVYDERYVFEWYD